MPAGADTGDGSSCQARFERRWRHLTRPHERALAWLLDAPDLLDANAPYWRGRIAAASPVAPDVAAWLADLEADPAPLDAALGERFYSRLGLYAEKLMAFYFAQRGTLAAHGLQVRATHRHGKETVGEFDFLLDEPDGGLRHIEFATKFYLLDSAVATTDFDLLVGPNLADTLGRKMRKIFDQQLVLGEHPAAREVLPRPVTSAQALVKGWLFYPPDGAADGAADDTPPIPGITPDHCRGRRLTLAGFAAAEQHPGERFMVMPRLQWLAPLKARASGVPPPASRGGLAALLAEKFAADPSPVMVAVVREEDGWLLEQARAFIVRDDWPARAALRRGIGEKREAKREENPAG
jgi:hypothetical protein